MGNGSKEAEDEEEIEEEVDARVTGSRASGVPSPCTCGRACVRARLCLRSLSGYTSFLFNILTVAHESK